MANTSGKPLVNPYETECEQTKANHDQLLEKHQKIINAHVGIEKRINEQIKLLRGERIKILSSFNQEQYFGAAKNIAKDYNISFYILDQAVTRTRPLEEIISILQSKITADDSRNISLALLQVYAVCKLHENNLHFNNALIGMLQGIKGSKTKAFQSLTAQQNNFQCFEEISENVPENVKYKTEQTDILLGFMRLFILRDIIAKQPVQLMEVDANVKIINDIIAEKEKITQEVDLAKTKWRDAIDKYERFEKWANIYCSNAVNMTQQAKAQVIGVANAANKYLRTKINELETRIIETEEDTVIVNNYVNKHFPNEFYFEALGILRKLLHVANKKDKIREKFKVKGYEVPIIGNTFKTAIPENYETLLAVRSGLLDACKSDDKTISTKNFKGILKMCKIVYSQKEVPKLMRAVSAMDYMSLYHIIKKEEIKQTLAPLKSKLKTFGEYLNNQPNTCQLL